MKKEIVHIDKTRGIARITTIDERWYSREIQNEKTGLPQIDFRPSVTYIGHFYPKGKGFEQYLKRNGEEADILVQLAAERGSKVHQAIEQLNRSLLDKEIPPVKIADKFLNTRTGQQEELTPDEYGAVMSYRDWWNNEGMTQYRILSAEETVWPEGPGSEPGGPMHFAGTLDILVERLSDGAKGVIDIKTSKDIYPTHIIQASALATAKNAAFQAILQVGYARNQKRFKFTEVPNRFDLFLAAKMIWAYETQGDAPLQRDFPLELALTLPTETKQPEKAPKVGKPKNKTQNAGNQIPE